MNRIIAGFLCLLAAAQVWGQCSPIVIDLNRNGVRLGPEGRGVNFDVNADGFDDYVQWVRPNGDEAFLALDRNRNGLVDDGSELFGIGTPLFEGGNAPNGFVGLAQYDTPLLGGNDDGLITQEDAIWPELSIWLDRNADGVSTANEMLRPADLRLTSFETIPKARRLRDPAGNALPYWAKAIIRSKKTDMVDVYFQLLAPT